MKKLTGLFLIALTCVVGISSCKKEARTSWDTEMLVPIATTNLSLQNIVKDTSALKTNSDNSLTLAFKKTLYSFQLADQVVNIPDTSIGQKFTLDSLFLGNIIIDYKLSLGLLARTMIAGSDPFYQAIGSAIIAKHQTYDVIPPITGFGADISTFDGSSFFQTATLSQGELRIFVNNYFPVEIKNIKFQVRNVNNNVLIVEDTIQSLGANDSVIHRISLVGKTIESRMNLRLVSFETPGSNGQNVYIDTGNFMKIYVEVADLHASDAIAIFPEQDIVSTTQEVTQIIEDRKLTYVDAREGQLHVFMTSSVQQPLDLTYKMEGAYDRAGNPLTAVTHIPAAAPGQTVTVDHIYDVAGFSINLTGKDGTKFNTYTQTVRAHVNATGQLAHITLADSLHIQYTIQNIKPNYIKGYIGQDEIAQIDSADFDFLNMFQSGSIDLQDVNMNFSVENGIGVDGMVKLNNLVAESAHNGSRALTGSILGQQLTINRATDFPLTPAISNFALNSGNSNIKDLLGILPNKLRYNVEIKTNLGGNNQQYRDFAYLESALKLNLNAEIPLSIIANHLTLKDTFDFDLSGTNLNVAGIKDGVINLIAKNKFPIEAILTMIAYDENWAPVDTITGDTHVLAGDLDGNCRVQDFKKSKIPLFVNEDRMENLKRAKHAVITADFSTTSNNTTCNGQYLKIYSDYNLDITFTAQFNYKIQTHF